MLKWSIITPAGLARYTRNTGAGPRGRLLVSKGTFAELPRWLEADKYDVGYGCLTRSASWPRRSMARYLRFDIVIRSPCTTRSSIRSFSPQCCGGPLLLSAVVETRPDLGMSRAADYLRAGKVETRGFRCQSHGPQQRAIVVTTAKADTQKAARTALSGA